MGREVQIFVSEDGREFLSYAQHLIGPNSVPIDPFILVFRAPAYPALLSLFMLITPGDTAAVFLMHIVLGSLTMWTVARSLRRVLSPYFSSLLILLILLMARVFMFSALSEWLAINLLLILFAQTVDYLDSPRSLKLFWIAGVSSILVLTRPPLIVVLVVPIILAFRREAEILRRVRGLAVVCGLIPLWIWFGFNQWRLGSACVTPRSGVALITVASLLGELQLPSDLPPIARQYGTRFNLMRRQIGPGFTGWRESAQIERAYNHNLWQVADRLRRDLEMEVLFWDASSRAIGLETIKTIPGAYAGYVATQFLVQFLIPSATDWLLVLVGVGFIAYRRNLSKSNPVFRTLLFAVLVHFGHMLTCVISAHMLYRFFVVTYYPMIFLLLSLVGCRTWELIRSARAARQID